MPQMFFSKEKVLPWICEEFVFFDFWINQKLEKKENPGRSSWRFATNWQFVDRGLEVFQKTFGSTYQSRFVVVLPTKKGRGSVFNNVATTTKSTLSSTPGAERRMRNFMSQSSNNVFFDICRMSKVQESKSCSYEICLILAKHSTWAERV